MNRKPFASAVILAVILAAIPLLASASTSANPFVGSASTDITGPDGSRVFIYVYSNSAPGNWSSIFEVSWQTQQGPARCSQISHVMPIAWNGGSPTGLTFAGTLTGPFNCVGPDPASGGVGPVPPPAQIVVNLSLDPQVLSRIDSNWIQVLGGPPTQPPTVLHAWFASPLAASGSVCVDSVCTSVDGWDGNYGVQEVK